MMQPQETDIAVNTMRSRLTVLGFVLTIITFQISQVIYPAAKAVENGGLSPQRFGLGVALLLGALVTLLALVVFIMSSRLNREGTCSIHFVIIGDLLMYLALIMTLFIFISPYEPVLDQFSASLVDQDLSNIRHAVLGFGVFVWIFVGFVAPGLLMLRLSVSVVMRLLYFISYSICLALLTWLVLLASNLERGADPPNFMEVIRSTLFAPMDWTGAGL
ncbi:hypothetical protein [Paracoccus aerodenitrificans]|uniref:hypothetical protein n=1 Tax=Paracoccus aerodenitrificans TaxID=3017781 RepID=UPI0022F06707|nr:hypothetical protein [Paracoccus aerodenitrificans]WBU62752.1 hypothetical protein PAE61_10230 [Paracoccus aerodenitrificans]